MLALSPWVAFSVSFSCILPNPTPTPTRCQERSDKQVSVASLRDVKELGGQQLGDLRQMRTPSRASEEAAEEVTIFPSEGDLLLPSPAPTHCILF